MKIIKEKSEEQALNKYTELSNAEKDTKTEYGRNKYRNMSEEDREKLRECLKTYCEAKKIIVRIIRNIIIKK